MSGTTLSHVRLPGRRPLGNDGPDYLHFGWNAFPDRAEAVGIGFAVGTAAKSASAEAAAPFSFPIVPEGAIAGGEAGLGAGWSVASAGDLNGDGYGDVVLGAPAADGSAGRAWVLFGSATGIGAVGLGLLTPLQGFAIAGAAAGDEAGWSVAGAGDFNGDGFADVAIGARRSDPAGPDSGGIHLLFGHAGSFSAIDLGAPAAGEGLRIRGAEAGDFAGASVAAAGDVNGDGFADLILGAPHAEAGAGAAYVIFGRARAGPALDLAALAADQGFAIKGAGAYAYAGSSVASAGDVNGDGFDDLIVGAPRGAGGGAVTGEAYVIFGHAWPFGTVDLAGLAPGEGFALRGAAPYDYAGCSVASAGDVDGDGFDDLIVGARYADADYAEGDTIGKAYVVFGHAGPFEAVALGALAPGSGFEIRGEAGFVQAGLSVASAGDINGDGFADLLIGAPYAGEDHRGRFYLIFGSDAGFGTIALDALTPAQGFIVEGPAEAGLAGWSVASAGDVDGDGYDDLIVGAPGIPGTASDSGAAYIIYGHATGEEPPSGPPTLDLNGAEAGTGFAASFVEGGAGAAIGQDIAVTAPGAPIVSATITVADALDGDALVLAGPLPGTIVVQSGLGTGRLVLAGAAPPGDWAAALALVRFASVGENPDSYGVAAARTISVAVSDGLAASAPATATIAIAAVNDAPSIATSEGTCAYAESVDAPPTAFAVDPGLIVADPDNGALAGATVTIAAGFEAGEDLLAFVNSDAAAFGNISASYSAGMLTLSSAGAAATLAQWQAALRAVTYANRAEAPSEAIRTIAFAVHDGAAWSAVATRLLGVTAQNDSPAGTDATLAILEDSVFTLTAAHFGFSDADGDAFAGIRFGTAPAGGTLFYAADGPGAPVAIASFPTATYSAADIAAGRLSFVPNADLNGAGAASIGFTVIDDGGTAGAGRNADPIANLLRFDIGPVNDPPAANDDGDGATEDGAALIGNVGSNDSDVDEGATLAYALIEQAPAGLTLNADGSYSFDPSNAAYQPLSQGAAQVVVATYRVTDDRGATDTATLTITVMGANDAPDAVNDEGTTREDEALLFAPSSLTANDGDADDGDVLSVTAVGNAAGGAVVLGADGGITFTPAKDFNGLAAFDYWVSDGRGGTAMATVAVTVAAVNDAPAGTDRIVSLLEDQSYAFTAADFGFGDPVEGHELAAVIIVSLPSAGTLTLDGEGVAAGQPIAAADLAGLLFTPAANGNGEAYASLTFQVRDDGGTAAGGQDIDPSPNMVRFDVAPVDDAPAITGTITGEVIEAGGAGNGASGTPSATGDLDAADPDGMDDAWRAVAAGALSTGGYGTYDVTAEGLWTYVLDDDHEAVQALNGSATLVDRFTVLTVDGTAQEVTVTIRGRDDAPINSVPGGQAIDEDGALTLASANGNAISVADVDSGTLTVVLSVGHGTLTLTSTDGLAFAAGANGTPGMTVSGTVAAINAALGAGLIYASAADYHGPDAISVATRDDGAGGGLESADSIVVAIAAVNDAPVADDDAIGAREDSVPVTGDVGSNDTDVDEGATRAYALDGPAPAGLTFNPDGSFSFDPSGAAYQHLAAGATAIVTANYMVTDDGGAADSATLTITITGVNDAPVANDDTVFATEDGAPVAGSVAGNDGDADDGATRTFALGASVAGLTLNGDGSYGFDPSDPAYRHLARGATQIVAVAYTVTDEFGATDAATLTVTLTGENDAPFAGDDFSSATEDGAIVTGSVAGNDGDADDGATLAYALDGPAPAGLTFQADGSYSFDPSSYDSLAAGATPHLVVGYTVTDQHGGAATATFTIIVTGVDDGAVAQPDSFAITEAGAIAGGNLFANDADVDGPALAISAVNGSGGDVGRQIALVSGALLTVNADGMFSYDPNGAFLSMPAPGSGAANVTGQDSFSYTLAGGNTVIVAIAVMGQDSDGDILFGTNGNDVLNGGVGADRMVGKAGDDAYFVDNIGDVVIEVVNEGYDIIYAGVSYALAADSSVEVLATIDNTATTPLNLTGNALANYVTGNAGANILDGGAGPDQLWGRGGDDSYYADAGDDVVEYEGDGYDILYARSSYALGIGQSIEVLATIDNTATTAINLAGNALSNYIVGNAGANTLDGGGGDDQLWGREGDDSYIADMNDIVLEYAGQGNDILYATASYILAVGLSVETLATADNTATTAINLTGNALDNYVTGNAGANTLDGGTGSDLLWGRGGDDSYFADGNDVVREDAGQGSDIIYARGSFVLGAGVSVEILGTVDNTASTAINLKGNELSNFVTGNAGANILDGGLGADQLFGRGGPDIFAFTTVPGGGNVDAILDFAHGADRIALDDAVFAGTGAPGSFNANAFVLGSVAQDANDRIVYNQATGQLFYDADGSGPGTAMLFAVVAGAPSLAASDFTVI